MIIPKQEIIVERTDKLSGVGLCRKELGNVREIKEYSKFGLLAHWLTPEVVNQLAANVGGLVQTRASLSQNQQVQNLNELIGYTASEGTKVGLEIIKKIAINADKMIPLKGILQLMRYCSDGETDSFIQNTTVAEIIAALPINNDKAYHIYSHNIIASPEVVSDTINYSYSELENIGFLLYYMVRAKCDLEELKYREHLQRCLRAIGMENKKQDYEIQYRKSAPDKARQIQETCCGFENMRKENMKLNAKYVSKVVKKMSYYMPKDCENQQHMLIIASQGMDAIIDKDPNLGINVLGQAVALVTDTFRCKSEKDDAKEACHSYLVQEGVEGNFISKEIIPASEDIAEYYDDMGENHV